MAEDSLYLVLDLVNDLANEDGPNGKTGYGPEFARRQIIANTALALGRAREAGAKIGYVRIGFSPDYRECPPNSRVFQGAKKAGMFKLGTWGTEVHPALAPRPEDFDIVKHRVSPFYATSLPTILTANKIRRLFLSGVSTTGAVLSGAKDGHDRDYEVFVLEDCCCAQSETQHWAAIEQMQRIATITAAASAPF